MVPGGAQRALNFFVNEGILVECDLEDTLAAALTSDELRKIAKEMGLPYSGTKKELSRRTVLANRNRMAEIMRGVQVLVCSEDARRCVADFEEKKEEDFKMSLKSSYELLLKGRAAEACRTAMEYRKRYGNYLLDAAPYFLRELTFVVSSTPDALRELEPKTLAIVRALAGNSILWPESPLFPDFVSEDLLSNLDFLERAIGFVKCNARIKRRAHELTEFHCNKVELEFDDYDIQSCDRCRRLAGKIFEVDNVPNLPLAGCTSPKGCQCSLTCVEDDNAYKIEVDFSLTERDGGNRLR
jgi:hypothetical protein